MKARAPKEWYRSIARLQFMIALIFTACAITVGAFGQTVIAVVFIAAAAIAVASGFRMLRRLHGAESQGS